jgi:3-phosphoshikimate 1-carboxyvinyltransferase
VLVSKPYIDATLAVLAFFGLKVEELPRSAGYIVRGNQTQKGRKFEVPGDMSAGAAIICATLAASGESELVGINAKFPQPDAEVISIARRLGSTITQSGNSIYVRGKLRSPRILDLNMKQSPDLVPAIAGLAAAKGFDITISNVRHLRYKESDRLSVLARELRKLGVRTIERRSSLQVDASVVSEPLRKPILMDPEKDHRMLMAFAIAGLSGRYGEIFVSDPDCVKKSYPNFVKDLQFLCHDKKTLRIVEASR